jgi:hypothetical protein
MDVVSVWDRVSTLVVVSAKGRVPTLVVASAKGRVSKLDEVAVATCPEE